MAHLTLNAFPLAIQTLEKVALINNRFKNNLYLLIGIAHKKKGDTDSALSAVSRQISLNEDEEALFYRARIYLEKKKHDKAIEDMNRLLMKNPHHAASLILKTKTLTVVGSYKEAL